MARHEHPREDLLRDAKALLPRLQIAIPKRPAPEIGDAVAFNDVQEVFAGWRGDALSLYFDQDPVYHFNAAGALRRGFHEGRILKAVEGRLVTLVRQRTHASVTLVPYELNPDERAALIEEMHRRLNQLGRSLASDDFSIVGQLPVDGDAVARLADWLRRHPEPQAAERPNVG